METGLRIIAYEEQTGIVQPRKDKTRGVEPGDRVQ